MTYNEKLEEENCLLKKQLTKKNREENNSLSIEYLIIVFSNILSLGDGT